MADVALFMADLALGLLLGCVFAVIAHGLILIWGVAKVVNVAHGEFIMLGAYGAYFLNLWFGFNPLLSVPVDAAIGLAVGVGFYFGFLHRELRGKESMGLQSEMVTLVATFGLALFLINAVQALWTGNNVGIPWSPGVVLVGSIQLPLGGLYVAIMSVAIIGLSHVFLTKTYLGNAIRAYSQDIPATQLVGINPTFTAAVGTALGFCITMAGGALLTVWLPTGIFPAMGNLYAPISFVIVVLGGPGKMWGSLVGGLTLGVIINVGQLFVGSIALATAIGFLTLIPVLLLRPRDSSDEAAWDSFVRAHVVGDRTVSGRPRRDRAVDSRVPPDGAHSVADFFDPCIFPQLNHGPDRVRELRPRRVHGLRGIRPRLRGRYLPPASRGGSRAGGARRPRPRPGHRRRHAAIPGRVLRHRDPRRRRRSLVHRPRDQGTRRRPRHHPEHRI